MSVLTPIVETFDGATRRIYLKAGVTDYFPIEDIYHEYRNARKNDEELRKFDALIEAAGNVTKGGGAFTPRYVVLLEGTKVVPFNDSFQINQLGEIITDDPDTDPSIYDISSLTVAKPIFIKPSEAETIQLNSESIVFASFQGAVWINKDSPFNTIGSAAQPNGNTERPVNTASLAVQIAQTRGFDRLKVIGDYTFDTGDEISDLTIEGQNPVKSFVIINEGASADRVEVFEAHVAGTLDGSSTLRECLIDDLDYINGYLHNCILNPGTIKLGGGAVAFIINSYSGMAGMTTPIIDMGGSGQGLAMRGYNGGITLTNKTGTEVVSIDLASGRVILTDTYSNGVIIVRGDGKLVDEFDNHIPSGNWNGATVINETTSVLHQHTLDSISTAVWGEVSRTLTESAGLSVEENAKLMAIPTTPLLDNDARLDNLDAPISTSGTSPTEIWSHASATSLLSNVTHIRDMTGGRWKVQGTQMIFYKEDNTTEVARFNLTDSSGNPTSDNPLQRIKV